MTSRIIIFVLLLLNLSVLSAQQRDSLLLIQGVVMDGNSLGPLPNTHFILNKVLGNVTDEKGEFSVFIGKNDTIRFTYVGYQDFVFSPSDTLTGDIFIAGIFMQGNQIIIKSIMGSFPSEISYTLIFLTLALTSFATIILSVFLSRK